MALVAKVDSVASAALVGPTTPGLSVGLWVVFALFGFSSLAAQTLPFLAGLLTPAFTYLLGVSRRLHPLAAGVGAILIAVSPAHISLSGRVKQFTVDAILVALLLLVAGLICDRPESIRRWIGLTVTSLVGIVTTSITAVGVAGAFTAVGVSALRKRSRVSVSALILSGVVVTAFSVGWWLLVLSPRVSNKVNHYWRSRFIGRDDGSLVAQSWDHFVYLSEWFITLPAPLLALLLLCGLVAMHRRDPISAVLLSTPILALFLLSVLGQAPFGGGRTDLVIYPPLALLAGASLDPLVRHYRAIGAATVAGAIGAVMIWPGTLPTEEPRRPPAGRPPGLLAADAWPYPHPYPLRDLRPLIQELERQRRPDDAVLLGLMTLWPYALYTTQPIEISEGNSLPGIRTEFGHYQPGRLWRSHDQLARTVGQATRVWVLIGPLRYPMSQDQERQLRSLGFERTWITIRTDARLELWTRPDA